MTNTNTTSNTTAAATNTATRKPTQMDIAYDRLVTELREAFAKGAQTIWVYGRNLPFHFYPDDLSKLLLVNIGGKDYSTDGELKSKCEMAIDGLLGSARIQEGIARMELIKERLKRYAEREEREAKKAAYIAAKQANAALWGAEYAEAAWRTLDPHRHTKEATTARIPRLRDAAVRLLQAVEGQDKVPENFKACKRLKVRLPFMRDAEFADVVALVKALREAKKHLPKR